MAVPFPSLYTMENVSGMMSLMSYGNELTEEFFGTGLLIFIGVILLIATKNFSTEKSFGFTTFSLFIIALLFRFMQLISDTVLYVVIVALVGSVVWLVVTREQESA